MWVIEVHLGSSETLQIYYTTTLVRVFSISLASGGGDDADDGNIF